MIDKVFLDTNIFLYAKFNDGGKKFQIADDLLRNELINKEVFISTQVVNEFCVNAIRKGKSSIEVHAIILRFNEHFNILPVNMGLIRRGFKIFDRYQFSHWDSLIIAAALESKCTMLYTEDLQDGQIIDGVLEIKNPFFQLPK